MKKTILTLLIAGCFPLAFYAQTTIHAADFESGLDGWTQDTGDNFDWTRQSGGTPSSGTGPNAASSGNWYLYAEMSSPRANGDIAIITSPTIDLTTYTSPSLTFDYHMYSSSSTSDVGTLDAEINVNGGGWNTVIFTKTGSQNSSQSSWLNATVDLTAYQGNSVQIRFKATRANSWRGDIAFDNVKVTGFMANVQEINITGLGNTINDGDSTPTTTDDTNFGSVGSGSTVDHIFTIENLGNSSTTLNLTGVPIVAISGDPSFTVLTQPSSSSIIGGNALTFVVRFAPTVNGTVTANIFISNDDSNEDPYNFTIQGTGVAPLTTGPGGVTNNLQLWLRADDGLGYSDSQAVQLWANQGRGSDASTNLSAQAPIYRDNTSRNINFNPVVDFSNTPNSPYETNYNYTPQQYLKGDDGFFTEDIFIVAYTNSAVTSSFGAMDMFCGDADNSNNTDKDITGIGWGNYSIRFSNEVLSYAISTTPDPNPSDVNSRGYGIAHTSTTTTFDNVGIINSRNNSNGTSQELNYNANNIGNTEVGLPNFKNIDNSRFWIGRSQSYRASYDGRIAEIITFSSRQNDTSIRPKIESYLAIKYGITLGVNGTSMDYVNSAGTKIWDVTANAGFNYDIAGIGQDDASKLYQKQSKSVNPSSLVAIGLGEIAPTNSANPNSFNTDKDFLVWGNNNAAFNTSAEISHSINLSSATTTFTPVSRKWKIIESQNDVPEVMVSIPTASLTSNIPLGANEEYTLVVSDDASFGASNIIDVIPLTINGTNSEVWYDFDGTKYFTFAKATRNVGKRRIEFSTGEFLLGDKNLELNSNFTVSAWVKNNGLGGTFISKGTGYNFKITNTNYIQVDWNGSTQIISTNTIDNKWHHIALTFNAGTASLYLDGILDKTVNSLPNPTSNSQRFTIGALYTNKNSITSFDGAVDEVRIWNSALTIDEIHYIMNQEIEAFGTNVNGKVLPQTITKNDISSHLWNDLKAYYDMNSFYGTTVEDNSNNKNWARIKYLTKDKLVVESQTAPLPYESAANGNWDTATTWLNNTVQYLPNTTINGTKVDWNIVETNNNINTTRNVTVLGLKNNANELSINADNSLTVTHYLLLDGVIDLDGESQLIQTEGSDFDDASTGYLERDQQGEGNKYRYNDWSSPVIKTGTTKGTPFSIADVLKDGTNPSAPGPITYVAGYDGAPGPPIQLSEYWMYKYADAPDGDYSSWQQIGSTGTIKSGEGFLMKGTGDPGSPDQNYVFVGKPNNGDVSVNVSGGNDYLVGNPYPSAIDSRQFIIDNGPTGTSSITGTIYYWEHYGGDSHNLADYQAGYATYSLAGGVLATAHPSVSSSGSATKMPEQYLPVSQGFFVQGDADGGTIIFKNSQRIFETEASGNSVFMKANSKQKTTNTTNTIATDTRPKYRIGFDAPQIDHRQILLTIDENTTDAVDWGYDAEIYEIFEDDMYWTIANKKYVIQATNTVAIDKEIPIGIVSVAGGDITIKIDSLENITNNLKVYLKDKDLNQLYDLSAGPYQTKLPPGEYLNKYVITFKQSETLSVDNQIIKNNLLIYTDNLNKTIHIKNKKKVSIKKVILYNTLGQKIKAWSANLKNDNIILNCNVGSGVYLIEAQVNTGKIAKKIVFN
jgi:hypothetical protein